MRGTGLLALVAVMSCACAVGSADGPVSDQDLRSHEEGILTYPGSSDVFHQVNDERDSSDVFGSGPNPASVTGGFSTSDRVDRVVAWYDAWLAGHGWSDAQDQGNGDRRWERGAHEDFDLTCSESGGRGLSCLTAYLLRSTHFGPPDRAAPPFGDPVSVAIVAQRRVGLAATEDRVQYLSAQPMPIDGTSEAAAARSKWSTGICCAMPVILADTSEAEASSGTRSAYHAVVLEVAEYNRPDVPGGAFGRIQRQEMQNLGNSGSLADNVGIGSLQGQSANVYLYERGLREAVLFAVAYGPPMAGGQGVAYRVATVQVVYAVAPKSCDLSRPECFDVLAGTAGVIWAHA
ncbi:MAG TPA: hypothetical protein VFO75_02205 [Candidatus Dormibacteraeota bacterium]|nr:hypothetical protein [Candidatus Dormibacteraeota bacterium]